MVDWDRVEQLKEKGRSWEEIAADPKVAFKPDQSVTQAGPALRRLYYRRKSREERVAQPAPTSRRIDPSAERKWTLARVGFLLVPIAAIWFAFAYVAPSPVGLILSAIPYIALILAGAVFILAFGLLRTTKRWTKVFRSTLILGLVLGVALTGLISLTAILSGCPFLPSASSLTSQPGPGWAATPSYVAPWHENGLPAVYFYGATWCPYCSASSWAIWKALTEFQSGFSGATNGIPGTVFAYSSADPAGPYTPEVVLAGLQVNSPALSFVVSEDTSGVQGNFPGTANCVQQAYVSAYSGSAIPFMAINGQFVHGGSTLLSPSSFASWANGQNGGTGTVSTAVLQESGGAPWDTVQPQAAWICAYVLKSNGFSSVASFLAANPSLNNPSHYQWTAGMTTIVNTDLGQI